MSKVTPDEILETICSPVVKAFNKKGVTLDFLAGITKEGLEATAKKTLKVKGAVNDDDIPKGFEKVLTSGVVHSNEEGNIFGAGEFIITWEEINHQIRQKTAERAHKLRGDYPSEKHEIGLSEDLLVGFLNALPSEFRTEVCRLLAESVSAKDD